MKTVLLAVATMVCLLPALVADAGPAKKKYHFQLTQILVKPEVKAEVAKEAQPRVEAVFQKALESHPQLVATLDGAPADPEAANGQPFRTYLKKKGIAGAFLVTVEVTEADIEIVPMDKKNSQRIVASVGIHVLGETIPGRTMGFTGDGRATVKQEIGMRIRDKDRQFTWDSAAETAVAQALEKCFAELAKPPAPTPKKKKK